MRPRRFRKIGCNCGCAYFKPRGVPMQKLEEIELSMDEYEALRLRDYLDIEQIDAAKKMGVSQSTFFRDLRSARKEIAQAIIEGKAIRIRKL